MNIRDTIVSKTKQNKTTNKHKKTNTVITLLGGSYRSQIYRDRTYIWWGSQGLWEQSINLGR